MSYIRRTRRSETPTSRRIRAIAGGVSIVLLLTGCGPFGGGSGEDKVTATGAAFLADWAAGRYPEAAARTTDPVKAEALLRKVSDTLRVDGRSFRPGVLSGCKDNRPCVLPFDATLSLDALGDWSYPGALTLKENPDHSDPARAWQVEWSPAVVHPKLTTDTALARVRELPPRAEILDRNGKALVTDQAVVRVGVAAGKISDPELKKLAELLHLDYAALLKRTQSAPAGQFVEAVVLRRSEYQAVGPKLDAGKGVVTRNDTLPLAPTRQYARGVLGSVGPATKETLAKAGPTASSADAIGSSGLEAVYQQQLAGQPGGRVDLVKAGDGSVVETLQEFAPAPGKPLQLSLDKQVQDAAESALASITGNASLVAVDTETGEILAVANSPADRAGDERALNGRYAPGSTFKIVTTTALLRTGLSPSDTVACPPNINIGGKVFENYDGLGSLGNVPFREDFTESCNTAFISKAKDLAPDALQKAANSFGIGGAWDLGLNSFSGSVPTSSGAVDQAAAAIGQGRVLMSPLGMASVAATVASGTPRTPRLVLSGPPSSPTAAPSPAGPAPLPALPEAGTLRDLMLATVASGTAHVLEIPGEQVGAKTGTAEYGSGTQAGLHAWMVGFLNHIAFAVLVENGVTGATTAGPIARNFLLGVRGLD
jgi:cell division protein FtsI/penicillin-binding protein 2